jgi:hypothetical protein
MSKLAIRLSALAVCATALAVIPVVMPAEAGMRHARHFMKHHKVHKRWGVVRPWTAGPAAPIAGQYNWPSPVCPGSGRSFECRIWPPPYDEDPDRKVSKH